MSVWIRTIMELCQMPMQGEWEKKNEVWIEISDLNIKPRLISSDERQRLEEYSRKRCHSSRKRRYEVPKQKYHSNTKLKEELRTISEEYPNITSLYSIGTTEQNREILVLKLSSEPTSRQILKPQVKLIGGSGG